MFRFACPQMTLACSYSREGSVVTRRVAGESLPGPLCSRHFVSFSELTGVKPFINLGNPLVAFSATSWTASYSFTNLSDSTVPAPTGTYFGFADAATSGNKVALGNL
jgi:hypothetical protein